MVILTPTRHGSPSTPRRRTRLHSPSRGGRRPLAALGLALTGLLLAAAPALGQDTESLPIPEGSPAPTSLSGGGGGTLVRLGIGLLVVLAIIAAVWWVMKRVQRARYPGLEETGGPSGPIEVVATTALGPGRNLHLVRVGEELVLIGATDHSVGTIVRIGAEDAPDALRPSRPRGEGDRARAVETATDETFVERLRALTTRRS